MVWDSAFTIAVIRLELGDPMSESYRYFVRVDAGEKEKTAEIFTAAQEVCSDTPVPDEAAFVTALMTEKEMQEKSGGLRTIKQCIRLLQD